MSEARPFTITDWVTAIIGRSWLILGSVVLFAGAWALVESRSPPVYISTTVLALSAEQAAEAESLMRAPVVLDSIAAKFPALRNETPEATRRRMNRQIEWSIVLAQRKLKPTLFQFDVKDQDPGRAQQIANNLIDQWLELTKPKPITQARVEVEISRLEKQLKETSALVEKFQGEAKTLLVPNSLQGELARPLFRLLTEREQIVSRLTERRGALSGVSREIVLSPPTLPVENAAALTYTRSLFVAGAIGAAIGVLLALMLEWLGRSRAAFAPASGGLGARSGL